MGNCGSSSTVKKQRNVDHDSCSANNSTVGGLSQCTKRPLSSSTLTDSNSTTCRLPASDHPSRFSSRSLRIVTSSIPPGDECGTNATRAERSAAPFAGKQDPKATVAGADVVVSAAANAPKGAPGSPPPVMNSSLATPFGYSQFAYPESPQLLGPRNGEMSCRQRTGSLPPYTATPSSPPATIAFPLPASPDGPCVHRLGVTKELIEQLQSQLVTERSSSELHTSNKPARSRTRSKSSSPSSPSSRRRESDVASNDEKFVAMRKQASIQNVLSWMESGSTLCREESCYSHMITASPTDEREGDGVPVAVVT